MYFGKMFEKTRKYARAGLISGLSILPFTSGCESPLSSSTIDFENLIRQPIVQLPEKLTQQTLDFYMHPEWEFYYYEQRLKELTQDKVLDSTDAEKLEYLLTKTFDEITVKLDNLGSVAELSNKERYVNYCQNMRHELEILRSELILKQKWLNTKAYKGEFWSYGNDMFVDGYAWDNEPLRSYLIKYKENRLEFLDVKSPRINKEFPAKTKLPFWLGIIGGLVLPVALTNTRTRLKRKKRMPIEGFEELENESKGIISLVFSMGAMTFFDALHPIVYPARLSIPAVRLAYALIQMKNYTPASPPAPATFVQGQGFVEQTRAQQNQNQEQNQPKKQTEIKTEKPKEKIKLEGYEELTEIQQETIEDLAERFKNLEID